MIRTEPPCRGLPGEDFSSRAAGETAPLQTASDDHFARDTQIRAVVAGPNVLADRENRGTQSPAVDEDLSTAATDHRHYGIHMLIVGGGGPNSRNGHGTNDAQRGIAVAGPTSPDPTTDAPKPTGAASGPVTHAPEPTTDVSAPRSATSVRALTSPAATARPTTKPLTSPGISFSATDQTTIDTHTEGVGGVPYMSNNREDAS